jgi:hypothetical protein
MSERPVMPPLFQPLAVTPEIDPFERGLQIAPEGAEEHQGVQATAERPRASLANERAA